MGWACLVPGTGISLSWLLQQYSKELLYQLSSAVKKWALEMLIYSYEKSNDVFEPKFKPVTIWFLLPVVYEESPSSGAVWIKPQKLEMIAWIKWTMHRATKWIWEAAGPLLGEAIISLQCVPVGVTAEAAYFVSMVCEACGSPCCAGSGATLSFSVTCWLLSLACSVWRCLEWGN